MSTRSDGCANDCVLLILRCQSSCRPNTTWDLSTLELREKHAFGQSDHWKVLFPECSNVGVWPLAVSEMAWRNVTASKINFNPTVGLSLPLDTLVTLVTLLIFIIPLGLLTRRIIPGLRALAR